MIFVTLGSQKFQFNRLLIAIDKFLEENQSEEVFAQIGYSDYKPKNYSYEKFIDKDKFNELIKKSNLLITHGGTGAIIGGVKEEKKVIAVPRLKEYGEHVDNHQLEIVKQFEEMNLIYGLYDINDLGEAINSIKYMNFRKYNSNTLSIINIIDEFISSSF